MAGSVPVWGAPKNAREESLATLTAAGPQSHDVDGALAYHPEYKTNPNLRGEEPFGFGDIIDIINPLQHIPLVGSVYRELTGDTIRPSGRIVGGALYGGALGAAAGLVNVIVAEETGSTLDEKMIDTIRGTKTNRDHAPTDITLAQLDAAQNAPSTQPTPENLLAFHAARAYDHAAEQQAATITPATLPTSMRPASIPNDLRTIAHGPTPSATPTIMAAHTSRTIWKFND